MKPARYLILLLVWLVAMPAVAEDPPSEGKGSAEATFNEQILPILKEHCYKCHSHVARKTKGGLVLDSKSGWVTGGDSGPAVVPGKPDESLLISAIRYQDLEMPPGGKLPVKKIPTRIEKTHCSN